MSQARAVGLRRDYDESVAAVVKSQVLTFLDGIR